MLAKMLQLGRSRSEVRLEMCDALKLEVSVLSLGHHVARFRAKVVGRRMSSNS